MNPKLLTAAFTPAVIESATGCSTKLQQVWRSRGHMPIPTEEPRAGHPTQFRLMHAYALALQGGLVRNCGLDVIKAVEVARWMFQPLSNEKGEFDPVADWALPALNDRDRTFPWLLLHYETFLDKRPVQTLVRGWQSLAEPWEGANAVGANIIDLTRLFDTVDRALLARAFDER